MQTYQTRRKTPGRKALPGEGQDISKSEMLHLSGAGAPQPISPALREKFEPGFHADFSNIRISRGHIPEEMGVQAVAQGTDILLDESAGMDVLGHELAHVVQQAQGRVDGGYPVVENAALEHEADVMGARVASGLTAQAGTQNGFGGEMMSIAPMSSASAPAQCKSKEEKQQKKDAKTMQRITDAEQRRDAAIAGGGNSHEARKAFGTEMEKIVNGMSQRQLQSQAFQDRMVSIAAGPVNSGMRQKASRDDGSITATDYALLLRGVEYEPEMRGMNSMAQRLLGAQAMADIAKSSASAEERMGATADQLGANPSALRMMKSFKQQIFAGVDNGVMSDETVQNNLMANNYLNRIFGSAGMKLKKPDKEAKKGAAEIQRLAKTDTKTGQFSQSIPEVQKLVSLFADPAAQASAPQPAPAQAATAPLSAEVSEPVYEEVEEPNSTQEMLARMERATINRAIPPELFDEMTDERGNLLDAATIASRANAAFPADRADMLSLFDPKTMPRREARAANQAAEGESFYNSMQSMFDDEAEELEMNLPHAPVEGNEEGIFSGLGHIDGPEEDEDEDEVVARMQQQSAAPIRDFERPSYMKYMDSLPMDAVIGGQVKSKKKHWWQFWK